MGDSFGGLAPQRKCYVMGGLVPPGSHLSMVVILVGRRQTISSTLAYREETLRKNLLFAYSGHLQQIAVVSATSEYGIPGINSASSIHF